MIDRFKGNQPCPPFPNYNAIFTTLEMAWLEQLELSDSDSNFSRPDGLCNNY